MDNTDIENLGKIIAASLTSKLGIGNSTAPAASAPASTSAATDDYLASIGKLISSAKELGQEYIPLAAGMLNFANSTTAASNSLQALNLTNNKAIASITKSLETSRAQLNEAGKVGIGGGSPSALGLEAAKSGLTIAEFTKTIADSNGALAGLGRTAKVAVENYSDITSRVLESTAGKQLIASGMQTAEMAKLTAIVSMSTKVNASDIKGREQLAASTLSLATQLDETARLTGLNRETMANEIAERNKTAESIAWQRTLSVDQRTAYTEMQGTLADLGDEVGNAMLNVVAGARMTDSTIATKIALGESWTELEAAMVQRKNAVGEAEIAAAKDRLEQARIGALEYQKTSQFQNQTLYNTSEIGTKSLKIAKDSDAAFNALQSGAKELKKPSEVKTEVQQNQLGLDASGKPLAGAAVMTEINKGFEGIRLAAVGGAGAVDKLNNTLSATPAVVNSVTESFKMLGNFNKTSAQYTDEMAAMPKKVASVLSGLVTPGATVAPISGPATATPSSAYIDVGRRLDEQVALNPNPHPLKRKEGSLGATGSMIEDFGTETPALLHGKEGVITENQFNDIKSQFKLLQANVREVPAHANKVGNSGFTDFEKPSNELQNQTKAIESNADRDIFGDATKQLSSLFTNNEKSIKDQLGNFQNQTKAIESNADRDIFGDATKQLSSLFTNNEKSIKDQLGNFQNQTKAIESNADRDIFGDATKQLSSLFTNNEKSIKDQLGNFQNQTKAIESNADRDIFGTSNDFLETAGEKITTIFSNTDKLAKEQLGVFNNQVKDLGGKKEHGIFEEITKQISSISSIFLDEKKTNQDQLAGVKVQVKDLGGKKEQPYNPGNVKYQLKPETYNEKPIGGSSGHGHVELGPRYRHEERDPVVSGISKLDQELRKLTNMASNTDNISKQASEYLSKINIKYTDTKVGNAPVINKIPEVGRIESKIPTRDVMAPHVPSDEYKNKPVVSKEPPVISPIAPVGEITIKDLHTALINLNTNMMRMVSYTESISESSHKTARHTRESTGLRM